MDMKSLIAKMDQLSQVDEAKPDFLDIDKDGDKKEPMKKAAKEKGSKKEDDDIKESNEQRRLSGAPHRGPFAVKSKDQDSKKNDKKENDKEKVDEALAIQADGDEAMALLDMLKLAGRSPQTVTMGGCGMTEADRDPAYANTPDEEIAPMDAATPSGTDMHREKEGWRTAAGADNPMVAAMEGKLRKMFESLSKE